MPTAAYHCGFSRPPSDITLYSYLSGAINPAIGSISALRLSVRPPNT